MWSIHNRHRARPYAGPVGNRSGPCFASSSYSSFKYSQITELSYRGFWSLLWVSLLGTAGVGTKPRGFEGEELGRLFVRVDALVLVGYLLLEHDPATLHEWAESPTVQLQRVRRGVRVSELGGGAGRSRG